jgi:hypothetical protein
MTSSAKITSNCANARASTGPKSKSGRMRAARNALRHGLSTSIDHDPMCRMRWKSSRVRSPASALPPKFRSSRAVLRKRRSSFTVCALRDTNSCRER